MLTLRLRALIPLPHTRRMFRHFMFIFIFFITAIYISYCPNSSTVTPSVYRAAVYQQVFQPAHLSANETAMDIMLRNVNLYKEQIRLASEKGVEIIVFPEYGITGPDVPTSRQGIKPFLQAVPANLSSVPRWIPCLDAIVEYNTTVLFHMSCAAREAAITTVFNIVSSRHCQESEDCLSDGVLQYNTDVVLDPEGALVARYDKYHLYGEQAFDQPPLQLATFQATRANVTFGIMTCFDLIWGEPMLGLLSSGVSNIVFPTAWIDGLPFLTAVQIQESRSIGYGINILAADIPGYTGSFIGGGIYSAQGAIEYIYGNLSNGVLIVADVPSVPLSPHFNPLMESIQQHQNDDFSNKEVLFKPGFIIYDDLVNYTLSDAFDANAGVSRVCHSDGVCCEAQYQFVPESENNLMETNGGYHLASYKGPVKLGGNMYTVHIEVCSILWCLQPDDPNTCSRHPVLTRNKFQSFAITGNFSTSFLFPNVLTVDLQLVNTSMWMFEKVNSDGQGYWAYLKTNTGFQEHVLVASIYGSNYA